MNRNVAIELAQMQERLLGYVTAMSYSYSLLCVKADPMALLGLKFDVDGAEKSVEELAYVVVHNKKDDDDKIDLIPKTTNEAIPILSQGVTDGLPELIQTIESDETDEDARKKQELKEETEKKYGMSIPDTEKSNYLRLTMPPVDDDRKKVLDDAVKIFHDEAKAKIDANISYYTARIALLSAGEDKESLEEIQKNFDSLKQQYEDMREKLTEDKNKEISDANDKYHHLQEQKQQENKSSGGGDEWKSLNVQ